MIYNMHNVMYNLIHSIVQNDSYKICKYTKQPYTLYIIRNPTRYISYQTKLSVTSEIRPLLPSQLPVHWRICSGETTKLWSEIIICHFIQSKNPELNLKQF